MSDENDLSILEYSEDISGAEAPPPLPAREYPATIEGVEMKTSQKGNNYLSVSFRISPDDFPPDFDAENYPEGAVLRYNRVMVDDTAMGRYRMRKFCEAIGAKMSKKIDPHEWIGLDATLNVANDTYEGETRAQIKDVKASS